MNSVNTSRKILAAILFVLAAFVVYWYSQTYERVSEEVDLGFGAIAKRKPYLAAEIYLNQSNIVVESSALVDITDRLIEPATFILANNYSITNEDRIDDLLDWVASGGRLIVGAPYREKEEVWSVLDAIEVSVKDTTDHTKDYLKYTFSERSQERSSCNCTKDNDKWHTFT